MQAKEAARILQHLADGLDPATGEALPKDSPFNQPDAIRALFTAIRALEGAPQKDGPAKAGGKWTDEEDRQLAEAFDKGSPIKDLAQRHERTQGAIRSRLVRLGRIDPASGGDGNTTPERPANPKPNDDIPF